MLKIHILGGPGSGKTTFAQELSALCNLPHHDLDKLMWKNGRDTAGYIADVASIIEQPAWISEGIFLLWTDPLLQQADAIVLMDVSWPVAGWRIVLRHITKTLRRNNPYPSRLLYPFLKSTRQYYLNQERSVSATEHMSAYLEKYPECVVLPDADAQFSYVEEWGELVLPPAAEFVSKYLARYKEKLFVIKDERDRKRVLELLVRR